MKRPAFLLLLGLAAACSPKPPHYDLLLSGGSLHDGSGRPVTAFRMGIVGDRIVTMDAQPQSTASHEIDASGLVVMPGFIDPHTHALSSQQPSESVVNERYLRQGVTTLFVGSDGNGLDDPASTLAALETVGTGTNVAFFAGHGQVREAVLGMDDRPPSAAELEHMRELVANQMEAGAYGLSTGLFYAPGSFSATDEVVALAETVAAYGGVYDTHLRDESSYTVGLLAAVDEAIEIAHRAHIPVHISHIKALGKDVWGQSADVIARIELARFSGFDITANQYPWRASGTRFSNALIPRWAMAGDLATLDAEQERRMREQMRQNLDRRGGPAAMLVTDADSPYRGQTLDEIAASMAVEPIEAGLRLANGDDPSIASFVMDPGDIEAFALQPWVMTGSDGSRGHPRLYGTYPKAWQDLVRSGKLSADAFAYRSAGLVGETFRVCGRGKLSPGYLADVVIFDPDKFVPGATYEQPTALATGVVALIVNGQLVIDGGDLVDDALAGKALRKTTPGCPE